MTTVDELRSMLVDPLTGLVTSLEVMAPPEGAPVDHCCLVATVADPRAFARWTADRVAGAAGFHGEGELIAPALGEAVERYCGNNVPADLRRAAVRELREEGLRLVAPRNFPGYDESLLRSGFPYRPVDEDTPLLWAEGLGAGDEPTLVPGSRVYLNWHQGSRRREPRDHHIVYSGIAAGPDVAFAELSAFLECVERDATMAWWCLGLRASPVAAEGIPGFTAAFSGSRLEPEILLLPSPEGVPVFAVLVEDVVDGVPAMGFSAHPDPVTGMWKAAAEAVQVWVSMQGVKEADGPGYRAVRSGVLSRRTYLPHSPDRRYLDMVREDFSDVRELATQAQLWWDPRLGPRLEARRATGELVDPAGIPECDAEAIWREYRDDPRNGVVRVNVTTSDIERVGLQVVRVCCPRMIPNFPPAFPTARTGRWREHLDYSDDHRSRIDPDPLPLPHM